MACRCAPSLLMLRQQLNQLYPRRDRRSDGCCGDAAHAARKSDHNPLKAGPGKGYAHAEDLDEDIVANLGPAPLWDLGIRLLSDPRTKYLIYEAQLLYPDGTVKPYHGINDHRHHLHISEHDWATFDVRPWPVGGFAIPKEKDVTESQGNEIIARLKNLEGLLATGKDDKQRDRGPLGGVVARLDQRIGAHGGDLGALKTTVARIEQTVEKIPEDLASKVAGLLADIAKEKP